ncbi:MAG: SRPBCC domain-containing protein [Actinomycetota bacterium]|nr:SRPBCC domain-containing protein [Actinomycetota bacterium]
MTEPHTYEVSISRYFDASPELVFKAFTDPDQIAQWFGPITFHVPRDTVSIDARSGGHWNMTMVSNDNPEWRSPITSVLTEVVENQLLVGYEITKGFPGMEDGTKISMSVEFIPEGDGTRLELRQSPFPEEMRDMSETGWNQSLYKLDALLATPAKFQTAQI